MFKVTTDQKTATYDPFPKLKLVQVTWLLFVTFLSFSKRKKQKMSIGYAGFTCHVICLMIRIIHFMTTINTIIKLKLVPWITITVLDFTVVVSQELALWKIIYSSHYYHGHSQWHTFINKWLKNNLILFLSLSYK